MAIIGYINDMNIHTKIFFIILAFCLSFSLQLKAQETKKNYSLSKDTVFKLPPPEQIEPGFLNEMNDIYEECKGDFFSSGHRDCKCYAMSFLEERLKHKYVRRQVIDAAIRNTCYDLENIKGHYFGICTGVQSPSSMKQKKTNIMDYCTCFGNKMAEIFPKIQILNFVTIGNAQTSAYGSCSGYDVRR